MESEIEHEEGFDPERWCKYKVFAVEGLHFEGVEFPMKVAMVEEYYPKRKRNKEVKFFVITTFEELSAMEMRELGHLRWRIENNGFRALNDQTNCKHVYTHDENAFDALMMILFIAWNLLNAFVESLDKEELRKVFGKVKFTLRFFSSLLLRSFGSEVIPEVTWGSGVLSEGALLRLKGSVEVLRLWFFRKSSYNQRLRWELKEYIVFISKNVLFSLVLPLKNGIGEFLQININSVRKSLKVNCFNSCFA